MRRLPIVVVCSVLVAGCGGSSSKTPAAATTAAARPSVPGQVLYAGGDWTVVVDGGAATAYRRVAGVWHPDRSGKVKIEILGPQPGTKAAATPQLAVQLSAGSPLVESGMWVDNRELAVKGGGLKPERGTIYGAPDTPLAPGKHMAVAYARTDTHATAAAWSFHVG